MWVRAWLHLRAVWSWAGFLYSACLSVLMCPKGVVIIHSVLYTRYVWRIHSLHTCEPLWTLHGPITDRFKNSVCYYYCLKVDFCQSDGYEMEFNMVVIGIPVLVVRLSIFSSVYWSFRFLFYSIVLFLFLMNCRSSLYILPKYSEYWFFVSYMQCSFFPQACCMIFNLIYGIFLNHRNLSCSL